MRHTYQYESGTYATHDQKVGCVEAGELGFYLAIQKLGRLEDWEDYLEIDLNIFFKALLDGAYFRNPYYKDIIEHFENLIKNVDLTRKCFDIRMEYFVPSYEYSTGGVFFPFEEYGETWALTKEELL